MTPIERDGRPLAAIVHDEALLDEPELLEQVAAAVALEIERDNNLWALQASDRRSRAILEAIPDKIFRVRTDGIVLDLQEDRKSQPVGLRVGSSVYDAPISLGWLTTRLASSSLRISRQYPRRSAGRRAARRLATRRQSPLSQTLRCSTASRLA